MEEIWWVSKKGRDNEKMKRSDGSVCCLLFGWMTRLEVGGVTVGSSWWQNDGEQNTHLKNFSTFRNLTKQRKLACFSSLHGRG